MKKCYMSAKSTGKLPSGTTSMYTCTISCDDLIMPIVIIGVMLTVCMIRLYYIYKYRTKRKLANIQQSKTLFRPSSDQSIS